MNEIERMIQSFPTKNLIGTNIDEPDKVFRPEDISELAKAIEQYVIKARIEELKNINIIVGNTNPDLDMNAVIFKVDNDRRIAQLND